jgi:hypothetical protein
MFEVLSLPTQDEGDHDMAANLPVVNSTTLATLAATAALQLSTAELDQLANTIRREHEAVVTGARATLEHALAVGDALLKAKAALAHGEWLSWLKRHCAFSERMARNYMAIATGRATLKSATIADLGVCGALALLKNRPQRGRGTGSRSTTAPKSPKTTSDFYAFSFVMAWWSAAPLAERRRFIDGIGSRGVNEAIPPQWNMRLMPAGASSDEIARQPAAAEVDGLDIPAFLRRAPVSVAAEYDALPGRHAAATLGTNGSGKAAPQPN